MFEFVRVHLLQVWFDDHIQGGHCLQRIGTGERNPQWLIKCLNDRVDKQTVGVDGVAAVSLEREGGR